MQFSERRNLTRWFIILASFFIVILILWNTYNFFQIFKNEERAKMEFWASALTTIANANENTDIELPLQIITKNTTIPIFITDSKENIIDFNNIDEEISKDSIALKKYFNSVKNDNQPIKMERSNSKYQLVYYGDSPLLNKLKYYPVALLLIIILFGAVVYNFYRATKMATQNKLWAGMAKETAHQIGTPLSSLIGWLEILKLDNVEESTIVEIEKDITRLQTITDRFSKIGSEPVLEKRDIIEDTKNTVDYLQTRVSQQVVFTFKAPEHPIYVEINPALHSWTIENLVKNAIDAMKGKGALDITISELENMVKIKITDTGKGIPKNQFSKVFEPGFTTKKRGWGLGLSLTKRIVQEYHKGKIKVEQSEIGKGTTMQISYKTT
ncbi:PAS domain-containing sensor histidine kinase [Flavobacterium sp.]|uniref:sensor histidine kinase n=1 Tax=Flavobacterium sp. TaxID=239 RepID=UPI0008C56398|nr:HAMP domain-containing sensor histidine kinase [Flavobacterium sp.]OGS61001.1 MAG: two-component sensor histidine kinase [Flavobacteria bacterium GWF1_32_7]HBD26783.1 two-component sensor histidine kinase [Flavobacterium sp.]